MRHLILSVLIAVCGLSAMNAQFDAEKLEIKIGYHLHNAHANRFNRLIDDFNNQRYPLETNDNLGSVNFLHGMIVGGSYEFAEDFHVYGNLKHRSQFLEAPYHSGMYRSYLFRENSLEAGLQMKLEGSERLSHYGGAGIVLGSMSVFTAWKDAPGNPKGKSMTNIDHTAVLAMTASYEFRYKMHSHISLFVRPTAQYGLKSNVRYLNKFMDPQVEEGVVSFPNNELEKFNKGSLNGISIEAGVYFRLPDLL